MCHAWCIYADLTMPCPGSAPHPLGEQPRTIAYSTTGMVCSPFQERGSDLRYAVEGDGGTATLPPVRDPAMRANNGAGASVTSWGEADLRLSRFAVSMFDTFPKGQTRIAVPVVLIPRPDNEYDPWAVSVSAPKTMGGDKNARHLGFLYRHHIEALGQKTLPRLAELSGGEIYCTAIIDRDEDGADDRLNFDDPDDLQYAYADFKLDLPPRHILAQAIDDYLLVHGVDLDEAGQQTTARMLVQLQTFPTPATPLQPLSIAVHEGNSLQPDTFADLQIFHRGFYAPSSLIVCSGDTQIGSVALGYLFLTDERHRVAVLDGLHQLGIPAADPRPARPEAAADSNWPADTIPNAQARWSAGGLQLVLSDPDNPSEFAHYNPTTKTLWVEDKPFVAPACAFAARLGLDVAEIGVPMRRRTLRPSDLRDRSYEWLPGKPKLLPLHPHAAALVPHDLFDAKELERIARPGWLLPGEEPTHVERHSPWRPPRGFRSLSMSAAGVLGVAVESVHAGSGPASDGSRVRLTLSGPVGHGATPIPPCRWRWGGGIVERVSGAADSDPRRRRAGGPGRAHRRAAGVPGLWWTVAKAWLRAATVGAHPWRRPPRAAAGAGAVRRTGLRAHPRTAAGLVRARPKCRCRHDRGGAAGRRPRRRAPADRRPAGYSGRHRARLAARRPRQQPMVV